MSKVWLKYLDRTTRLTWYGSYLPKVICRIPYVCADAHFTCFFDSLDGAYKQTSGFYYCGSAICIRPGLALIAILEHSPSE